MALRYLLAPKALSQRRGLPALLCRSRGWTGQPVRPEHLLFANEEALVLPGGRGAILGSLYRAARPGETVRELRRGEVDAIVAGSADGRFWGGYLSVIVAGSDLVLRRDPSGALPCVAASIDGHLVFASDVALLQAAGLRPVVDLEALVRTLWSSGLPGRRTSLAGVEQLSPGCEARLGSEGLTVRQWWSPWDHAAAATSIPPSPHHLRAVIEDVVASLTAGRKRLMVGISGGLDSSIVAACVPAAGTRLRCFTASTNDPAGDERRQARQLAEHLELPLIEEWYGEDPIDLLRTGGAHLPNPCYRPTVSAYARLQMRLEDAHAPEAFLSGHGGDNVFGFSHSASSVVDRVRAEGFGTGVLSTIGDVAGVTGAGVLAVARSAWRRSRAGVAPVWRPDPRLLSAEVVREQSTRPLSHPWLDAAEPSMPGKAAHVAAILRAQTHAGGVLDRSRTATICPLLSQPVIEFCLSVPSWRWVDGGRDRALARSAFASLLPAAVVDRRTKGSPDGHARALYHRHRGEIRERLMDGHLSRAGAIDRSSLELAFGEGGAGGASDLARLLSLVDAENWIDHWTERGAGLDQSGVGLGLEAIGPFLNDSQSARSGC